MPGLGKNIGDAYIQVHSDTGPFRRELRRESKAAGDESGKEFDRSFGKRLGNLNFGLSRLKGSRNDFLNIIGSMAQGLENLFGKAIRGTFEVVGSTIAGFGKTIAQGEGPLSGFGKAIDKVGQSIGRIGSGGIDGLVVQILALFAAFDAFIVIAGTAAAGISLITGALTALTVTIGGGILGFVTTLGTGLLALTAGASAAGLAIAGMSKAQKRAFGPLSDWVKEIQRLTGDELFGGIGDQVSDLAEVLSSTLNPLLVRSAAVLREFFDGFVGALQGPEFSGIMRTLSAQLPALLRTLLSIASGLTTALVGIFAAAAPGANLLFEAINRVVQGFAAWATSAEGARQVAAFIEQATGVLNTLWDIAKSVGATLRILWEEGAAGGQLLLDRIAAVVQQFATWLGSTAGRDALTKWFNTAVTVAQQLGFFIGSLIDLFDALDTEQTRGFFSAFVGSVTAAIQALTNVVNWTQDTADAFNRLGPKIGKFFSGLGATATKVFGQISAVVTRVSRTITNVQVAAITGIINFWNRLKTVGSVTMSALRNAIGTLTAPFRAVVASVQGFISRLGGLRGIGIAVFKAIQGVIRAAIGVVVSFMATVRRVFNVFNSLRTVAVNAVNRIISAFRSINLYSIGVNVINGLTRGISAAVGGLMSYVRSIANQIAATFAAALDINSPSRVFFGFGENIAEGLALGISAGQSQVNSAVAGLVDANLLGNLNTPISALAEQGSVGTTATGSNTSIAQGAITIVTPFANPRLVALEVMDALAARGK